jgi:hypothetical protein
MKLTNKYGLPDAFVKATQGFNLSYDRGECDFSITELIGSPRIKALERKHRDDLEEDVSDRIWLLLGSATHSILEKANVSDIAEKRYFAKFGKHVVSAQVDSLAVKSGVLTDFKITSTYTVSKDDLKVDWVSQLNGQAEILRRNGVFVASIQIVAICRDWSKGKMLADKFGTYPKSQVVVLSLPFWSSKETESYINSRIDAHLSARENLPECSDEERYSTEHTWAVKIKGGARAINGGIMSTSADAESLAGEMTYKTGKPHVVEHRIGRPFKRCEDGYCSVAKYCTQFQNNKKQQNEKVG